MWPRRGSRISSTKKFNKGKSSISSRPSSSVKSKTTKFKGSTPKSTNLKRSRHRLRERRPRKRKYWSTSMRNHWRSRSKRGRGRRNRSSKTTKSSRRPGNRNCPPSRIRKATMTSSGRIYTRRMQTTWSVRWRRSRWSDNKNWGRSW